MDGNFSQKRHKCAFNSPEPFLVDQVGELWGKAEDVMKFDNVEPPAGDCVCFCFVLFLTSITNLILLIHQI